MIKTGIIAYTATEYNGKVIVFRTFAGQVEHIVTDNWDKLTDFLVEDKGLALHICWNLGQFCNHILGLLPIAKQRELEDKVRINYNGVKVFSTEHMLGITKMRQIKGNIYNRLENNFYSISHWLPARDKAPELPKEIEQLGYEIVEGLDKLGIYPDKLTSPIGLFSKQLDPDSLPTIYNFNEEYNEAMEWANQAAKYEWNKEYKQAKGKVHQYDLTSAYASIMLNLPDTRQVTAEKLRFPVVDYDWGVVEGELFTTAKVWPIDKRAKYFTTEEINWVLEHNLGEFMPNQGWFLKFHSKKKPYREIVSKLLRARNNNNGNMVNNLAKRIANGLSGKLDQYNKDGSLGELYNPILALMVRSRCRLKVEDFIYNNNLQDELVKVQVDSIYSIRNLRISKESLPGQFRKVK